jgi:DNA polymerase-3 subunit epsilon
LLDFLGDSPLVAHNAGFDFGFLNAELAICALPAVDRVRMVDTVAIARRKHHGAKLSLDALCSSYGIDRSHRVRHGALLDAELLAQLYVELMGGRQIGLQLAAEVEVKVSEVTLEVKPTAIRSLRPARPHAASAEELAQHAAFVEAINGAIWLR